MENRKRIMIVAKQNNLGLRIARTFARRIESKCDVSFDPSTALRLRKKGTSIRRFDGDFIITLGGDGTFLRAAHQTDLPILPVKLEGHGFLCTTTYKQLEENLARVLRGQFAIRERVRLRCFRVPTRRFDRYISKILNRPYPLALNEIAFGRKRPSKILSVAMVVDGVTFRFAGDGVMFATPAGSTAYNSSAGGSLIDPELSAISIIPLYPFYSKMRPMIVPTGKRIEVTVEGDCALVVDGHGGDYIKGGASFIVESGAPQKVIYVVEQNFYERFKAEFLQ